MTVTERQSPESIVTLSTPERMTTGMPEVHRAMEELDARRGELFCDFGFTEIVIGKIPENGPAMTFEESTYDNSNFNGYAIVKHDGGFKFHLGNSGRSGGVPIDSDALEELTKDHRMYLGHVHGHALPHGPTAVETSGDVKKCAEYKITRDTLVIGTRAIGAFALGKAMREVADEPRNIDLSLGLLIAATLEQQDEDWRPRNGCAAKNIDKLIDSFGEKYVDDAVLPGVLNVIGIKGGWPPHVNSIGNRLPLFGYGFSDLKDKIMPKIAQAIETDEDVKKKYEETRRWFGHHGNLDKYLEVGVDNFLTNRLGLTDPS